MSASSLYFLDVRGRVLISRNYRGDINMSMIEKFMPLLLSNEEDGNLTPVVTTTSCTFVYIKHNNLYIVFATNKNSNVALLLVLLYKIVQVMKEYFKTLEEESIKDNFVLIFELLDEVIDFGFPQTTDSKILQEYITQESHKLEIQPRIPMAVTNIISWRSEGIKYKKNEVFLDITEFVNVMTNSKGNVLRNEITGTVQIKNYLSGMPELLLGLNDKFLVGNDSVNVRSRSVELDDVKFHQCVRLSKFENDRTISFIPPDGQFELMSYRISTTAKPLIWVELISNHCTRSSLNYTIKVKSQFKRQSAASFVEIIIPVLHDVDSPEFQSTIGNVIYAPEQNAMVWKIKSFPGGKEYIMKAHFKLPSIESNEVEAKRPLIVLFEIPYFTFSGIRAKHLKVTEKSGYQANTWIRYATKNGEYQLRTS